MLQESKDALEDKLLLQMMSRIENNPNLSQRALSSQLGVAIGLVNTYLKRCIHKGWIKVQNIPTRRYTYYLTPGGFIEKTRLAVEYLTSSFGFFREAQEQFMQLFKHCESNGWTHIALVGKGDLADIASQVVRSSALRIESAFFLESGKISLCLDSVHAVIITDVVAPQETFEKLLEVIPVERILSPELLHISRVNRLSNLVNGLDSDIMNQDNDSMMEPESVRLEVAK